MAKNVESAKSLIKAASEKAATEKSQAVVEYRTMLETDQGDPERLVELMRVLGKTSEDLEADQRTIREAVRLQEKADQRDVIYSAYLKTCERVAGKIESFAEARRKHEGELRQLQSESTAYRVQVDDARRAKTDLVNLQQDHWQLFSQPEPQREVEIGMTVRCGRI
jgi:hypothetical protein